MLEVLVDPAEWEAREDAGATARRSRHRPRNSSPSCARAPTTPSAAARRCWPRRGCDETNRRHRHEHHRRADALRPRHPRPRRRGRRDAVPIAEALVAGGLTALEVTLRTPAALDVIRAMSSVEGAVVGAGTVLNARDLDAAIGAAPSSSSAPASPRRSRKPRWPPACPTCRAWRPRPTSCAASTMGSTAQVLPGGGPRGGLKALKALAARSIRCASAPPAASPRPTAPDWLAHPSVLCVGGSWVVPAGKPDPGAIRRLAEAAGQLRQA